MFQSWGQPEKKLKPYQMTYPEGLFKELGMEGDINPDQIEGLNFVMEKLKPREQEIVIMRYPACLKIVTAGSL